MPKDKLWLREHKIYFPHSPMQPEHISAQRSENFFKQVDVHKTFFFFKSHAQGSPFPIFQNIPQS